MNKEQEKACIQAALSWMKEVDIQDWKQAKTMLTGIKKMCPDPKRGISEVSLSAGNATATLTADTRKIVTAMIYGINLLLVGKYSVVTIEEWKGDEQGRS